ncbi:MAG: hypothetical protein Q7T82_08120 [Armatimonadota bacterium]|nr:hypothetical protein [Armatimonadota bacterium]
MEGKFIKGAFVEFVPTFLGTTPNVIVFQFNPETIQHNWSQAQSEAPAMEGGGANPLGVKGYPGETLSFTIAMEATDQLAKGNPIARASGIYSRLAALEMLLYPTKDVAGELALEGRSVPPMQLPTVLFVWGPGRILPVRVSSLNITEKLYDSLLNPTHAEAVITLDVLTPSELEFVSGPLAAVAKKAYTYSQRKREALAVANLSNSAESIIGMIETI